MLNRRVVALALIVALLSLSVAAQNGSGDMLSRIRKEAMERSQIMKTMHMFTDVYGPRLTGSPNHKAAAEWAVKQMTRMGTRECAPRAMGLQASGLVERAPDRALDLAS